MSVTAGASHMWLWLLTCRAGWQAEGEGLMNAFILYLWSQHMSHVCIFVTHRGSLCCLVRALNSPTTYSWAARSLMLQLFPATHVYLPVSSVVTSVITKEPLLIFLNLEERRKGTDEGGGLEVWNSSKNKKDKEGGQTGSMSEHLLWDIKNSHSPLSSSHSEMHQCFPQSNKRDWMECVFPSWHVRLLYTGGAKRLRGSENCDWSFAQSSSL